MPRLVLMSRECLKIRGGGAKKWHISKGYQDLYVRKETEWMQMKKNEGEESQTRDKKIKLSRLEGAC